MAKIKNDSVVNYGNNILINVGKGNDSIDNIGENVTIDCGVGNDTV